MRFIKWDYIKLIKLIDNIKCFNFWYSWKYNICSFWGEESIKFEENIYFFYLKVIFDVYCNSFF